MGSVLVCYSGGIDSALILAVAHEQLGSHAIGMTAVSPSLPESELDGARQTALQIGADHRMVMTNELARPGYVANGPDRCFHCKTELYELAEQKRVEWSLAFLLNGTNQDDLGDYRPGLEAASNARVRSPLLELGLCKDDVRQLAMAVGLKIWAKPAAACLASRIPYGTSVTPERLRQIEQLEKALHALGFTQVRVRYHDVLARIEVPVTDLARLCSDPYRDALQRAGTEAGFTYVTLDVAGYRQGSHNLLLQGRSLKVVP
ncbi:MAG: hypothetical protein RJA70_3609 [Pseudomonadota bacterium]|jgi:uncharacterized protein